MDDFEWDPKLGSLTNKDDFKIDSSFSKKYPHMIPLILTQNEDGMFRLLGTEEYYQKYPSLRPKENDSLLDRKFLKLEPVFGTEEYYQKYPHRRPFILTQNEDGMFRLSVRTNPKRTSPNSNRPRNSGNRTPSRSTTINSTSRGNSSSTDGFPINNWKIENTQNTTPRSRNARKIKVDLVGKLNLGPTFVDNIDREEMILYSNNKYYFIDFPNGNKKGFFLKFRDKEYKIVESERVETLEKDFLEKNAVQIKRYQRDSLDSLEKRFSQEKDKLKNLRESIDKSFSMESFFNYYVFAMNEHMNVENKKVDDIEIEDKHFKFNSSLEKISFLENRESILKRSVTKNKRINGSQGLLFFYGDVYKLSKSKNGVSGKKSFDLEEAKYVCSQKEFNEKYREEISGEIKKQIKKGFESEMERISGIVKSKKSELNTSKINNQTVNQRGDMGFDKKSEKDYILHKRIPEHIIKVRNEYYLMPPFKLGIEIKVAGNKLLSDDLASLYKTPHYRRPFVRDSGSEMNIICQGDLNDVGGRKKTGIESGKKYSLNHEDLVAFSRNCLKIINAAKDVLTKGINPRGNRHYYHLWDSDSVATKLSENAAKNKELEGVIIYNND